jgi:hypothetical protein
MFKRSQPITLDVVERAMDQGEDRRSGEDRREEPKPEPAKVAGPMFVPFLIVLIGLVVAASTYNFTRLETDYQGFKTEELKRHEGEAAWRAQVDGQLQTLVHAETERREQTKYLKAMARKMGLKVED